MLVALNGSNDELIAYNAELQLEVDTLRAALADIATTTAQHAARCLQPNCCVRVIRP